MPTTDTGAPPLLAFAPAPRDPLLVFKAARPAGSADKAKDARRADADEKGGAPKGKAAPPREPGPFADPETEPSAVYEHGDRVKFIYRCEESGVEVHGEGEIVSSGKDGATVRTEDGREHKVPYKAIHPVEDDEENADDDDRPVAKGGPPLLVFKSDGGPAFGGFGDDPSPVPGVPMVVFAMATAAQADAQAASAASAAPAEDPGPPQNHDGESDAAAQSEVQRDGRIGYLAMAFRMLRNGWRQKG